MKKYIIYFIAAYIWGMFLQFIIDLFRGTGFGDLLTKSNIRGICLGGFIFAVLMTLFKYFEKRKHCKK